MSRGRNYSHHHNINNNNGTNKNHFNNLAFRKAIKIVNSDPYRAKTLYEEYLNEYPNDYMAWAFYASLLITLKEFDKAEDIIRNIEERVFKDGHIQDEFNQKHNDESRILFSKIRLMSYRGQYKELLEFLNENEELLSQFNLKELKLYCEVKLGINTQEREENSYLARQIIKYDKLDMKVHANYNTADYNAEQPVPRENVFSEDFPIYTIFEHLDFYLPSDNALCTGVLADWYYFKWDCCGKENNKITNFFKVVTFHDTADIISICPVLEGENLPYVDLNYLKPKEEVQQKKKSRVDRFYQRYGIKKES